MSLPTDCLRCADPHRLVLPRQWLPRDTATTPLPEYEVGQVCTIFESMQKCAETILYKDSPGITPGTRAHWRCEEALSRIARFPAGKPRPCVLLTLPAYVVLGDYPTSTQTVVAGTTLRGTPYELLPELFKFFVVPVWPHPMAKEKIHIHSTPDWDNPKQWLFMYQFTSMQPILGLWPRGTPQRHSTVHLSRPTTPTLTPVYEYDEETISYMEEYSAERVAKWSQQCQDVEGFAEM